MDAASDTQEIKQGYALAHEVGEQQNESADWLPLP